MSVTNTSSEDVSLDSSTANLSVSSVENSPDIGASAAIQSGAGQSATPIHDEGCTEVSDSGTAQAGDLPQSPKEMANERCVDK